MSITSQASQLPNDQIGSWCAGEHRVPGAETIIIHAGQPGVQFVSCSICGNECLGDTTHQGSRGRPGARPVFRLLEKRIIMDLHLSEHQ